MAQSKGFKKFMAMAYGIGAAIVILGALFKLMHWPGASLMLIVGLGTEALLFVMFAFAPKDVHYHWERVYPQLLDRREVILQELKLEESRFLETLARGEKLLADVLADNPQQITGDQAFELYDTYGFPVELTQEIAEENSVIVDLDGFQKAMDQQRQRAKDANTTIDLTLQDTIDTVVSEIGVTSFANGEVKN